MNASGEPNSLETSGIKSRQDFVIFLNQLLTDYQNNSETWENKNLGDFLEALSRYAIDIEGYYQNTSKAGAGLIDANCATWRVFADMLQGATIYE